MSGELPPVVAVLTASTAEFQAKMGAARAEIGGLGASSRPLQALGKASAIALAGVAAAAVDIGVHSVKAAASFDAAMEQIHTQAGASQQEVDKLRNSVLGLSGKVAEAPEALAESLYHIESNGIRGGQAMQVLKTAAEGAQIGHANLTDTTNALTAAINSGIPGVQNFSQAMGALNSIVGSGDMQMQDLNDALGTGIVVIAKQYGNSLNDVGSALATFGDNNIRGAKAGTELKMAIMDLVKQSTPGEKVLAGIGIKAGQLGADMRKGGLGAAMVDLKNHLTAAGDTGAKVGAVLTDAFSKKSAAPLAILIDQLSRFQSKQEEIRKGAGNFGADWQATTKQFAFQMQQLKTTVEELSIRFGNWLIPKVRALAAVIADVVHWFEKHQAVAKALGVAILGALVPALAAFVAEMALATAAMLANPITWITLAAAALAVGIYELATHWHQAWSSMQAVMEAVWHVIDGIFHGIDAAWHAIDNTTRSVWGGIEGFFKRLASDVAGIFTGLWNGLTSGITTAFDAVVRFFAQLPGRIFSAIGNLAKDFFDFGVHIIEAMIKGIGNAAAGIGGAVTGAIGSAVGHIPVVGGLLKHIGLATGGLVSKPTFASIAENEPEWVIPQSWFQGADLTGGGVTFGARPNLGVAAVPVARTAPAAPAVTSGDLVIRMDSTDLARVSGPALYAWLLRKDKQAGTLAFR